MRRTTVYICQICGQYIREYVELVKMQPRGRYGKANTYHEACIEAERLERGYTNNLHHNKEVTK